MKISTSWQIFLVSLAVTPVAVVGAAMFAGGGDGSYLPLKFVLPYLMLTTVKANVIWPPFALASLLQFPLYGAVLAVARRLGVLWLAAILLSAIHLAAFIACLILVSDNFR